MSERILCTRREFIRTTGVVAVGAAMPAFLARAAAADYGGARTKGFKDDRILVVVQLGGGNDGLNTLVPFADDAYRRSRPKLALGQDKLITLGPDIAMNAAMKPVKELHDAGLVAAIEGVGYPNPNRSHFRSMEIWHTATDSDRYSDSGWLGRYLDAECGGGAEPVAGVAVGGERPQAFGGRRGFGVAFQDPGSFGWTEGPGGAREEGFRGVNAAPAPRNETLEFVRKVAADAVLSSDRVREVARRYRGGVEYPRDPFAQGMQTVAKMIAGGLPTRIYYVSLGGFDTHANQANTHDNLLGRFAGGVAAFHRDMKAQGNAGRVLVMSFSEFGRRVSENASGGTDHGTAAPMFLVGEPVVAGLHGKRPSLTDLDNGDLRHTTDFRAVYATVLDQWLGGDSKLVLGRAFPHLGLLKIRGAASA